MKNATDSNRRWLVVFAFVLLALSAAGLLAIDSLAIPLARSAAALKEPARVLSRYGDFPFLLVAGIVGLAFALHRGRRDWARILTAMILSGILAGLATNLVKLGTGRVRPRADHIEPGWYGPTHDGQWVSIRHDFQAFPSSHASCAFGFFFPLFFSRRMAGAAGLMLAALVAWSRVQLNAHHVSDVAAGALVGLLCAWLVWDWIVRRGGLTRWLGDACESAG